LLKQAKMAWSPQQVC